MEKTSASTRLTRLRAFFNKGKSVVDFLDNLWSTCYGALPAELIRIFTPLILGGFGLVFHLGEAMEGMRQVYRAYHNERIGQRKTRILSAFGAIFLAGLGFGMAVAVLASSMSGGLASILIPGLLTGISCLSLWRKGYIFYRVKAKEKKAKEKLQDWERVLSLDPGFSLEEREKNRQELQRLEALFKKWQRKSLHMERLVVFNLLQLLASSLVIIASMLGAASLVGASAASLGSLPVLLMVIGMTAGILCQLMEYTDRQFAYRFSKNLREKLVKWWEGDVKKIDSSVKPQKPQKKHMTKKHCIIEMTNFAIKENVPLSSQGMTTGSRFWPVEARLFEEKNRMASHSSSSQMGARPPEEENRIAGCSPL